MDDAAGAVALADRVSEILYGIAGWLIMGLGFVAMLASVVALADASSVTAVAEATIVASFGLLVVAIGAVIDPHLRRRLARRHSVTRFGRVRTVDHRVVKPEEDCWRRCTACGSPVRKGLIRRYRQEYAVAGVPLYTASEGHNYYCLECATTEVLDPDPGVAASSDEPLETGSAAGRSSRTDGELEVDRE